MAKQSEEFYRSVIDGNYDSRLKRSLENIKVVCDEREKHSARIYVGRIGTLCREQFGGPAAQSIRNKPDTLKKYIELRAAEQVLPAGIRQTESKPIISDQKTRAYVSLLEEQLQDSIKTINNLKTFCEQITPVEIDKLIADGFLSSRTLKLPPVPNETTPRGFNGSKLSEPARRALEKLTSEDHLKSFRLSVYKQRVVDKMMREFLNKDEYKALINMLAAEGADSEK